MQIVHRQADECVTEQVLFKSYIRFVTTNWKTFTFKYNKKSTSNFHVGYIIPNISKSFCIQKLMKPDREFRKFFFCSSTHLSKYTLFFNLFLMFV